MSVATLISLFMTRGTVFGRPRGPVDHDVVADFPSALKRTSFSLGASLLGFDRI